MQTLKPYYIRAIYQWTIDNDLTAFLLVNAQDKRAILPMDFVENDTIVLNIRPSAIQNLALENDQIEFDASFKGTSLHVFVPIDSVLAIFAQENNEGMFFDPPKDKASEAPVENKKPKLQIIK